MMPNSLPLGDLNYYQYDSEPKEKKEIVNM